MNPEYLRLAASIAVMLAAVSCLWAASWHHRQTRELARVVALYVQATQELESAAVNMRETASDLRTALDNLPRGGMLRLVPSSKPPPQ